MPVRIWLLKVPKAQLFRGWVLSILLVSLSLPAFTQSSNGSLRGEILDATGARIAAAKIVAQLSNSSVQREAISEDRGQFRIDDLLPGKYTVRINAAGFAPEWPRSRSRSQLCATSWSRSNRCRCRKPSRFWEKRRQLPANRSTWRARFTRESSPNTTSRTFPSLHAVLPTLPT